MNSQKDIELILVFEVSREVFKRVLFFFLRSKSYMFVILQEHWSIFIHVHYSSACCTYGTYGTTRFYDRTIESAVGGGSGYLKHFEGFRHIGFLITRLPSNPVY